MHKFFLALVLLSVPVSTGALAHSGSEQEQQACTRDVERFCRKLTDQGDFTEKALLADVWAEILKYPYKGHNGSLSLILAP